MTVRHLYLAGPYTKPDPITNTHAALQMATRLFERKLYVPHVPHLTLLWHMVTPQPIEFWYELDLEHLSRCDSIVRLPGESSGAERELAQALEMGLDQVPFNDLPVSVRSIWYDRNRPC